MRGLGEEGPSLSFSWGPQGWANHALPHLPSLKLEVL